MRVIKKVVIPVMPKEMIVRLIEFISDALIKDAKEKFGSAYRFKADMRVVKPNAIETYVQFFPYKYDFIWKISKDRLGHEVVLDARTPGKWRDSLFGMGQKLEGLVDTQWSAMVNFCHGYLTALAQRASKPLSKKHIRKTKKRPKER